MGTHVHIYVFRCIDDHVYGHVYGHGCGHVYGKYYVVYGQTCGGMSTEKHTDMGTYMSHRHVYGYVHEP